MRYPAHAAFFQPAQKRSAIWRLLLGIIVVGLVFALWLGGSFGLLRFLVGPENIESWGERLRAPTSPFETYLVLSTFLGMVVATLAAALLLHRRGLLSLIGLNGRIRTDFIAGAGIAFAILLISIALFLIVSPAFDTVLTCSGSKQKSPMSPRSLKWLMRFARKFLTRNWSTTTHLHSTGR